MSITFSRNLTISDLDKIFIVLSQILNTYEETFKTIVKNKVFFLFYFIHIHMPVMENYLDFYFEKCSYQAMPY